MKYLKTYEQFENYTDIDFINRSKVLPDFKVGDKVTYIAKSQYLKHGTKLTVEDIIYDNKYDNKRYLVTFKEVRGEYIAGKFMSDGEINILKNTNKYNI